ncbi:hypothetical protein IFM89_018854 [Coptis chinensis]|uniref:C3HC-type domain-containing protein n=1 Tax=Coptis chinensis TaxID=261450 RepID=A0A835I3E1_9MAGN|nr:hypothetical protein IFM89_018854 [Coptis chinensis]
MNNEQIAAERDRVRNRARARRLSLTGVENLSSEHASLLTSLQSEVSRIGGHHYTPVLDISQGSMNVIFNNAVSTPVVGGFKKSCSNIFGDWNLHEEGHENEDPDQYLSTLTANNAGKAFAKQLNVAHGTSFPWRENSSAESLVQLPPTPHSALTGGFKDRCDGLLQFVSLSVIAASTIGLMRLSQSSQIDRLLAQSETLAGVTGYVQGIYSCSPKADKPVWMGAKIGSEVGDRTSSFESRGPSTHNRNIEGSRSIVDIPQLLLRAMVKGSLLERQLAMALQVM